MVKGVFGLGHRPASEVSGACSAASGICRRSGIGRVRHLAVGQLWVQERIRKAALTLHKVRGDLGRTARHLCPPRLSSVFDASRAHFCGV